MSFLSKLRRGMRGACTDPMAVPVFSGNRHDSMEGGRSQVTCRTGFFGDASDILAMNWWKDASMSRGSSAEVSWLSLWSESFLIVGAIVLFALLQSPVLGV